MVDFAACAGPAATASAAIVTVAIANRCTFVCM
jgi:hypothetical protein